MVSSRRFVLASALALLSPFAWSADGDTEVLKWPDGKKAAFLLAFDDGAPSQLKYVVPELEKRRIKATYYLNPGNKFYPSIATKWEAAAKSPYVVAANHTFTHRGVTNAEELDQELAQCNEVLYRLEPEGKKPKLFGFAKPGGVPWTISKEDFSKALAKHHLVDRPPFQGPPMNFKSGEEMIAAVDAALAKGEMGHMDFHGVGTDWLVTPLDWFLPFLDKLEASSDSLWITDVVSWNQYIAERNSATVRVLEKAADRIRLELTAKTDPALYDHPLSLRTKLPSDWKRCTVIQGESKTEIEVRDGAIQYSALPDRGEIQIARVKVP